jgi:hypothetical protein
VQPYAGFIEHLRQASLALSFVVRGGVVAGLVHRAYLAWNRPGKEATTWSLLNTLGRFEPLRDTSVLTGDIFGLQEVTYGEFPAPATGETDIHPVAEHLSDTFRAILADIMPKNSHSRFSVSP